MFESIEIRKVKNGFIVVVTSEDDTNEYVYDSSRKTLRILKQYLDPSAKEEKSQ
jgi:hypothetical protein